MEEMSDISGLIQDGKLLVTNISTCISRCEKCIYGTTRMDAEMGEKRTSFINKNKSKLNRDVKERMKRGRD